MNKERFTAMRKSQLGVTLGETLLSLAIGSALVVGAYVFYTKASGDVRAQTTADGIAQIVTGIKDRFGPLGGYSGVTNQSLIDNAIVPKTFTVSGTTITSPYGAASTIVAASADSGATFTVTMTGLPKNACPVIVARIDSASTGLGAQATMASPPDLASSAIAGTIKAIGYDLNVSKTVTQCAADGGSGVVAILAKSV